MFVFIFNEPVSKTRTVSHKNYRALPAYFNLILFIYFKILFIYIWLRWALSSCCQRGYFSLWCAGSRHAGFSNCGVWALERRLSSCGARAQLLRGMWDLPGPGIEPVSPALAGGFSTAAPPGKSRLLIFKRA